MPAFCTSTPPSVAGASCSSMDAHQVDLLHGRASLPRQIEALIERRPQRIVDAQLERIGAGVADGGARIRTGAALGWHRRDQVRQHAIHNRSCFGGVERVSWLIAVARDGGESDRST